MTAENAQFKMLLLQTSIVLAAALQAGARSVGRYAIAVDRDTAAATKYDFIIVGGGTAGLTVADRLTEKASSKPIPHSPLSILTYLQSMFWLLNSAHLMPENQASLSQDSTFRSPTSGRVY